MDSDTYSKEYKHYSTVLIIPLKYSKQSLDLLWGPMVLNYGYLIVYDIFSGHIWDSSFCMTPLFTVMLFILTQLVPVYS